MSGQAPITHEILTPIHVPKLTLERCLHITSLMPVTHGNAVAYFAGVHNRCRRRALVRHHATIRDFEAAGWRIVLNDLPLSNESPMTSICTPAPGKLVYKSVMKYEGAHEAV